LSILIIVGGDWTYIEAMPEAKKVTWSQWGHFTSLTFSDIEAMSDAKKVTWSQWGHFTSLTNFSYA
jgi:hypothetical protein